jgi:hypothetical protein
MSHTTSVSAVSGSLRSPCWPRQTYGARWSPAFCVSPVSACPVASGLQIGLQNWSLPICTLASRDNLASAYQAARG